MTSLEEFESMNTKQERAEITKRILHKLLNSELGNKMLTDAKMAVQSSSVSEDKIREVVTHRLTKSGMDKSLHNMMSHVIPLVCREMKGKTANWEPLDHIRMATTAWEKRLQKSLKTMTEEVKTDFSRPRTQKEQTEFIDGWTDMSSSDPDLSAFRPVFAPRDLLEVIADLRRRDVNRAESENPEVMVQEVQKPLPLSQLKRLFADLAPQVAQCGVTDDELVPRELFARKRGKLAKKVLSGGLSCVVREFCKRGCPASERGRLWTLLLDVRVTESRRRRYQQLRADAVASESLIDKLIFKDIRLTVSNDDQHFVFEDFVYQVLIPFFRDTEVPEVMFRCSEGERATGRRANPSEERFPPNEVVPFHGFSMFVAPLCFVFADVLSLYFVFRELYTRHFFRLHTLSSQAQSIVNLCVLFESFFREKLPELWKHFRRHNVQPLRIAFRWMMRAFSGYLAGEQLLHLWDRILGFESLFLLPVLSVAIFWFRKQNLLHVNTLPAVEAVLADISSLHVVPLLQTFLFAEN